MHILKSGYAKNKDAMHLMQCLFLITASFSLIIIFQHLPGCHNQAPNTPSWDRLPLIHSLVPQALPPHHFQSPLHWWSYWYHCPQTGQRIHEQLGFFLFSKGFSPFNTKAIHICSEWLPPFLFSQESSGASLLEISLS